MTRRRRRWFREETLAPWLTLAVVLGLWWAGARLVGMTRQPPPAIDRKVAPAVDATPALRDGAHLVDGAAAATPARRESADIDPYAPRALAAPGSGLDRLLLPVAGVERMALRQGFDETRGGGRRHEAIDILAPRGTAVYAAADGRVAKLFTSAAGGLTIYQFDPAEEYAFYYAHLDGYAPDLTEGQVLARGQTIGYVGTTGNAPPGTPHLHFAIFKLGPEKRWWDGVAIDPFPLLAGTD
jgi:murein DD-endopeptidase MepM/ murein hydrolase activator NlpD